MKAKTIIRRTKDRQKRNTLGYYRRWSGQKNQTIKNQRLQINVLEKLLRKFKKKYNERLKLFVKDYFERDIYENLQNEINITPSTTKKIILDFMELWSYFETPEESAEAEELEEKKMWEELEALEKEKNKAYHIIKKIDGGNIKNET